VQSPVLFFSACDVLCTVAICQMVSSVKPCKTQNAAATESSEPSDKMSNYFPADDDDSVAITDTSNGSSFAAKARSLSSPTNYGDGKSLYI